MHACMHTYIHTCLRTFIHTNLLIYIHTNTIQCDAMQCNIYMNYENIHMYNHFYKPIEYFGCPIPASKPTFSSPRIMRNASIEQQLKAAEQSFGVLSSKACEARPYYDDIPMQPGHVWAAWKGRFVFGSPY